MKRDFIRYASHEIRTPLNILSIGLKLLKTDIINPSISQEKLKEMIQEMNNTCQMAISVLEDLAVEEKLDAGLMKLVQTELSITSFLRDTIVPFKLKVLIIVEITDMLCLYSMLLLLFISLIGSWRWDTLHLNIYSHPQ